MTDEFVYDTLPPSVWTATSTGAATGLTSSSATVAVVPMQTPTGSGDEETTLSQSTSGPSASTSAERDPPATTDGTRPTDDGTPAGLTSNTQHRLNHGSSHQRR